MAGEGGGGKDGVNILGLFRIGAFDPVTLVMLSLLGMYGLRRRRS